MNERNDTGISLPLCARIRMNVIWIGLLILSLYLLLGIESERERSLLLPWRVRGFGDREFDTLFSFARSFYLRDALMLAAWVLSSLLL
ncbi:hypothetical protein VTL71DRAFT_2305 [Oculimacula yallundae]|uniref:Uncharacterized protein n=1 Tax=Oculimacula yallundae TaxID=86028 RepID=A0ABR4C8I5_9HELO